MILSANERFTHVGTSRVEAQIRDIVSCAADIVASNVSAKHFHALALIGGYGRGEGGVLVDNGVASPNNNLDFLLITRRASVATTRLWQARIDQQLNALQQLHQIGIDFSIVSGRSLRRSPSRIMWYDMREGHKMLLGDASYISSLSHFRMDRVPDWDVHNLLVNRGTLLVINDSLPTDATSVEIPRITNRHTVKAIIGYGDALLYSHGKYHWSYEEKRRRMQMLPHVDTAFQHLYDQAVECRFLSDKRSPPGFLRAPESVRDQCEAVHRKCEARRLGISLPSWDDYLEAALRAGTWEDCRSPLGLLRCLRTALQKGATQVGESRAARLGQRMLSPQRVLSLLFPAVIYPSCSESYQAKAAAVLGANGITTNELRLAYLRFWGETIDRNFARFLQRFNISLDAKESLS